MFRLIEISILEESVLEREAFLLALAPFLVVEVDVSALLSENTIQLLAMKSVK